VLTSSGAIAYGILSLLLRVDLFWLVVQLS
jgi:hypothetical protein